MASRIDYLKLHFIVFLWGFSAILGKLVSIPALEMVFYRSILAALGMGIVILVVKGTFSVTRIRVNKAYSYWFYCRPALGSLFRISPRFKCFR